MGGLTDADFKDLPKVNNSSNQNVMGTSDGLSSSNFESLPKTQSSSFSVAQPQQSSSSSNSGGSMLTPSDADMKSTQAWGDRLTQFNSWFDSQAIGGLQLLNAGVRQTLGHLPVLGDEITKNSLELDSQLQSQMGRNKQQYEDAVSRNPSLAANIAGAVGSFGYGGLGAAKLAEAGGAKLIGQSALGSAAMGGLDQASSMGERGSKAAISGILGAAIPIAGKGLYSLADAVVPDSGVTSFMGKLFNPTGSAVKDYANAAKLDAGGDAGLATAAVQKAESTGIKGTPGELLDSGVGANSQVRQLEGNITPTEPVKEIAAGSINPRAAETKANIYNTIDNMSTPEDAAAMEAASTAMKGQYIGPNNELLPAAPESLNYTPKVVADNPTLSKYNEGVLNNTSDNYLGAPDNSVDKLAKLRAEVKDPLTKSTPDSFGHINTDLAPSKKAELLDAKDKLSTVLDQSDDYKTFNSLFHNEKNQQSWNDLLSRAPNKPGGGPEANASLDQVQGTILKNDVLGDKFVSDAVKAGADKTDVQQLVNTANSLKDAPFLKVLGKMQNQGGSSPIESYKLNFVQQIVNDWALGNYNKALVKFAASGPENWGPAMRSVLGDKSNSNAKALEFLKLLSTMTVSKAAGNKYGTQSPK